VYTGIDESGELGVGLLGIFRARIIPGKEFTGNDSVGAGKGTGGWIMVVPQIDTDLEC
jgi:hypothetical protein